jgi:hypothetical protein
MNEPEGLPDGVFELAGALVTEANARLRHVSDETLPSGDDWVRHQVMLPLEVERDWPASAAPIEVAGGAVHADLTGPDGLTFATMVATLDNPTAESLAAEAQLWRLPVTPYRRCLTPVFDATPADLTDRTHTPLNEVLVVDLTAMWAGPLATQLLAKFGAQVVKVESSIRPDGFRARPALFRALNLDKEIVDLDLSDPDDRALFEDLVRRADLVIDSFSRRVMPNFGYSPAQLHCMNPEVATISITAFPRHAPESQWISYGSGIHAASGLGMTSGEASPPPVAYPDPLTGLRAFAVALGLVGCHGFRPHVELSLMGSVAPLVGRIAR